MKKTLLSFFCATGFLLMAENANSQSVYWREGFGTWDGPTGDPGVSAAVGTATGDAGLWGHYGIWRTTGTGCPYSDGTPNPHIRSTSAAITGNGATTDTAYLVTPEVTNGISSVSFIRSRNNRRTSFYWTPDASITTTNWIFAAATNKSVASPVTTCTDTLITINQPTARRLQIRFEKAGNSDVDSIVLFSSTPLPINFANLKAYQKANGVQIEWSNATEANMDKYVIERSADGSRFTEITSVAAKGNRTAMESYTWYDATPFNGNNFYRIKGNEKDGTNKYTGILKVMIGKGKAGMAIAPNPVRGNLLNLQLSNLAKGMYTLVLTNSLGQRVYNKALNHEGGAANYQLQLSSALKGGLYNLQLNDGTSVINRKVIVE